MTSLVQDLRYALRQLRKSPGFTAVAVLTLALGIGANTAIFSLIYALMLRQLPVRQPGQLVELLHRYPGEPHLNGFSQQTYELMRDHNDVFSGLIAENYQTFHVRAEGLAAQTVEGSYVNGAFFPVLGIEPSVGRLIGREDDRESDRAAVAVLSWSFWKSRFNLNRAILGKQIIVDELPVTVVGVAPRGFSGLQVDSSQQIWLPLAARVLMQPSANANAPAGWVRLVGLLKHGVTIGQARSEMAVLFASTLDEWARSTNNPFLRKMKFEMEPAGSGSSLLREPFEEPLLVLMAVVALLLLLACTNVATMLLARGATRESEMALRVSLGASRFRLLRQGLTESLLLSGIAGILGIYLAWFGADALVRFIASGRPIPGLPHPIEIQVAPDSRVLLFTVVVSALTGVIFGLLPAFRAVGVSPLSSLHPVARTGEPRARRRFGRGLVSAQVAMAVVLLSLASLFIRYLSSLEDMDMGFHRDHVLLVKLDPGRSGYEMPQLSRAYQELLARFEAIPGVCSATICAGSPISGAGANEGVTVEGYSPRPGEIRNVMENWVAPKYFETLGTRLLKGRDFRAQDQGHPPVAIVNQTMARYYFGDADPIGRHVIFDDDKLSYEIVGVVEDSKYMDLREPSSRTIYRDTFQQSWVASQFALRTSVNPESVTLEVRRAVDDVLKTIPVSHVITLSDQVDSSIVPERLIATLSGSFGVLGALQVAIGLYGLLSYAVARRISEIGVRIALGATRGSVLGVALRDALGMVVAGLIIGAPLALWAKKIASGFISDLPAGSLLPVATGASGIIAIAFLASYIPARRAAKVDPMVALHYE
jgi:putative ABC transport system permease protein